MLLNNTLFNKTVLGLVTATFLISGCSKKSTVNKAQINKQVNKIYKYNPNNNIKNSKAMHRATLRSYTVFNVRYYPFVAKVGDQFSGIASWYGPNFHAKKTSNGETYNMHAMTAAHKTLPMNTMVKVVNLENGKTTIVRINDRGPFVSGRIIDLSNKAAYAVDMVKKGTAKVRITVLGYNGQIDNHDAPSASYNVKKQDIKSIQKNNIQEETTLGDFSLQVGAFSKEVGALSTQDKYKNLTNNQKDVIIKKISSNGRELFKVFIMGFNSYNQVMNFKELNDINGIIIEE